MTTTRRAILIVTVCFVAVWAWGQRTQMESPTQRAYRICAECADLSTIEVDWLIKSEPQSSLSREQSLEICRKSPAGGRVCVNDCDPCAMAALDAAGK